MLNDNIYKLRKEIYENNDKLKFELYDKIDRKAQINYILRKHK